VIEQESRSPRPPVSPRLVIISITLSPCFVYVLDQDEALRFYTGPVGLEVRTDAPMEQFRWLTVGSPEQPEIEIGLMAIGPPVPPADQDTDLWLADEDAVLLLGGVLRSPGGRPGAQHHWHSA
jgi:hypothetical protein